MGLLEYDLLFVMSVTVAFFCACFTCFVFVGWFECCVLGVATCMFDVVRLN